MRPRKGIGEVKRDASGLRLEAEKYGLKAKEVRVMV